ncbi:unnamed protein product [Euphydryas editha]|uniref:Uncharacterized protein n=1 Tax=Euphydryas editha TaxID=104508 RepID=A0AAU9TNB7_EUPED|nr:unnamed protein product [Euphydryas editha]
MPKRNLKEKIDYYRNKIRNLDNKHRRIKPIISSSESEDDTSRADLCIETVSINPDPDIPRLQKEPVTTDALAPQPEPVELEPDILAALDEANDEMLEYNEKIHESLAKIWLPIFKKGLVKESRESFLKNYSIPENCVLLQAPTLIPEIQAAIPESGKSRDKK